MLLTGPLSDGAAMAYEITTVGGDIEQVREADTYAQEGPLTTFFRTDAGRRVVDSWAVRLASFRTSEIARIRRLDTEVAS